MDTTFLGHASEYIRATADFYQENIKGVKAYCLEGQFLQNGNFIFVLDDSHARKMVLTDNNGTHVKYGYMTLSKVDAFNWKNTDNWIESSIYYYIKNFRGEKGTLVCLSSTFLSEINANA